MIYLDNAATSFPKPESVYRAMDRFARESLAVFFVDAGECTFDQQIQLLTEVARTMPSA